MTDIIIQGICGRMGRALLEKIGVRDDCRVVAGVDREPGHLGEIPIFSDFDALPCRGVIIDFSSPAGAVAAAQYGAANGLPCVICSTGLSKADEAVLEAASAKTPIFRSANMSVGVNVLIELARQATKLLGGEFDIEIIEKHHHNKLDAPSGTAITLAEGILEKIDRKDKWVKGTFLAPDGAISGTNDCAPNELPIASIREGEVFGLHTIRYESDVDSITITHDAKSRGGFVLGAVLAAEYTATHEGFLGMSDLFPFLND